MKLFPLLFLVFLQNCSIPAQEDNSLTPMLINSYKVSCQGFIPQQCFVVKEGDAIEHSEWSYFYDSREGFDYVPSYIYAIVVKKVKRDPVPQDLGLYRYYFVRERSKTAVD